MQSPLTPCTGCAWLLGESKPPVRISPSSTVQASPLWAKVSMEGQGLSRPMKREYCCVPLLAEWDLGVLVLQAGVVQLGWWWREAVKEGGSTVGRKESGKAGAGVEFGAGGSEGQLSYWM